MLALAVGVVRRMAISYRWSELPRVNVRLDKIYQNANHADHLSIIVTSSIL